MCHPYAEGSIGPHPLNNCATDLQTENKLNYVGDTQYKFHSCAWYAVVAVAAAYITPLKRIQIQNSFQIFMKQHIR